MTACMYQVLNMLCCWVEDPHSEAFKLHLPRVFDYLWIAEDGMKMQVKTKNSITLSLTIYTSLPLLQIPFLLFSSYFCLEKMVHPCVLLMRGPLSWIHIYCISC